jgi:hypothetical protein
MTIDDSHPPPPEPSSGDARPSGVPKPFHLSGWLPWIIAAGFAVISAWLGQFALVTREQNALLQDRQTFADFERRTAQNQLEAERIIARHEIAGLRSGDPGSFEISLLSPPSDHSAIAFAAVAWNPATRQGVLQVTNLPAPPAGQRYRLWITDQKKPVPVDAGDVAIDAATGAARVAFHLGGPAGAVPRFTLRLERKDLAPQSDAPVVLQGG